MTFTPDGSERLLNDESETTASGRDALMLLGVPPTAVQLVRAGVLNGAVRR